MPPSWGCSLLEVDAFAGAISVANKVIRIVTAAAAGDLLADESVKKAYLGG